VTELGWVHIVFCGVAIATGAVVLTLRKGTRWHRTTGHLYVTSMSGVVVSALLLYERNGRFGPFHFAAVVAGVTLACGLWTVLARRPRRTWMEAHATWMSWSYIGLIAALAAESLTHFLMPAIQPSLAERSLLGIFWSAVALASFTVVGVGAVLVKKKLPGSLERTRFDPRRKRHTIGDRVVLQPKPE
jgi:uncharacterized membrane protein